MALPTPTQLATTIYNTWTADTANNGFINPLPASAQNIIMSQCLAFASGIIAAIQDGTVTVPGITTGSSTATGSIS